MTARTVKRLGVLSLFLLATAVSPAWAQKTQKISKNLIKRAEKTVEEITKTEKQLDKTVKKYNDLLKKNSVKDREKEYKKLNDELKKTEKRIAELRKHNEELEKEANKFFTEWTNGLGKIGDPQLQVAAKENLDKTRARFAKITSAAHGAGEDYNKFLVDLNNQIAYLAIDLSDDAMSQLKTNQRMTNADAKALSKSIDEMTDATENYIKSLK